MKVKVAYYGIVEKVVEVDDKFVDILPAWDSGDEDRYDKLSSELHTELARDIPGEISQVFEVDSGELLYEL